MCKKFKKKCFGTFHFVTIDAPKPYFEQKKVGKCATVRPIGNIVLKMYQNPIFGYMGPKSGENSLVAPIMKIALNTHYQN